MYMKSKEELFTEFTESFVSLTQEIIDGIKSDAAVNNRDLTEAEVNDIAEAEKVIKDLNKNMDSYKAKQTQSLLDEFSRLAQPLCDFIEENFNPHTKAIIDGMSAEIVEGKMGIKATYDLKKEEPCYGNTNNESIDLEPCYDSPLCCNPNDKFTDLETCQCVDCVNIKSQIKEMHKNINMVEAKPIAQILELNEVKRTPLLPIEVVDEESLIEYVKAVYGIEIDDLFMYMISAIKGGIKIKKQ